MTQPPGTPTPDVEITVEEEDLLARSARALASEDPEGFIDLSARVRSNVRATTRRSRPVHATFPGGDADDVLVVREWVLVGQLREQVTALEGVTPTQITVGLEADRCVAATVHITATYEAVLAEVATQVRKAISDTLLTVLGADAIDADSLPIDVVIDDVIV